MITPLGSNPQPPITAPTATDTASSTVTEDVLAGAVGSFRQALARVERSERFVDRAVRRISHGAGLDAGQLLAVQAEVYRASQQAELVSRAVDRVSDTVREITQIKI